MEYYAPIRIHTKLWFSHIRFVNKIFMGYIVNDMLETRNRQQRGSLVHISYAYEVHVIGIYAQRKRLLFYHFVSPFIFLGRKSLDFL